MELRARENGSLSRVRSGFLGSATYRPRLADDHLERLVADFPAVMITGPRATGKTTSARLHAAEVLALDQPGVAAALRVDPDAALRRAARPLLLDEWQEVPEVLGAVKRAVDADPTPGQFLLTGSVRAELTQQTWAATGRVVRMSMYGLTERELTAGAIAGPGFLDRVAASGVDDLVLPAEVPSIDDYVDLALRSGFPEVVYRGRDARGRAVWLDSYMHDLVTRDAAAVGRLKDPAKLRRYLTAISLHSAGTPTHATLLESAGITAKTAVDYDQLLTDLYITEAVPAWTSNRLKRLVKAPKRYVIDPGLAAAAAGLDAATVLRDSDRLGRLLDAFGTAQLRAEIALRHPRPVFHHLRQEAGRREVDLVVELGAGRVVGIEFKAAAAVHSDDARHLAWLRDELGQAFVAGVVLHSGPGLYELGDRIYAVPLCCIWAREPVARLP